MKFKLKNPRSNGDRERMMDIISTIIQGYQDKHFKPYRPNEGDDNYWTLDSGNDWKIHFLTSEPLTFEIRYRYQSKAHPYEEALAGWLMVKLYGLEILPS